MPIEQGSGAAHDEQRKMQGSPNSRLLPKLTEKEAAIRRTVRERIEAKYSFENWDDAPHEALREFQEFLRKRTEAPR